MRLAKTLTMTLALLLLPLLTTSPASAAQRRGTAADRAWRPFFNSFRAAVRRRDRAALTALMSRDFYFLSSGGDDNGNGDTRDEAFEYWDGARVGAWEALDGVLAQGAVANTTLREAGRRRGLSRIAPPLANDRRAREGGRVQWYAVFEFRGGRWYCTSFSQCCD